MKRMEGVDRDAMSEQQRRIVAEIEKGPRGRAGGLMMLWLHSPELAEHAQRVGAYFRTQDNLPPHLMEMVVLITARHWECEYEWVQHEPLARAKGLAPDIIEAIRARRAPDFADAGAKAVYDFSTAMLATHRVGDDVFEAVKAHFGPRGIVDISILIGHYIHGAILLNAVRMGRPDGTEAPFPTPA